MSCPSADMKVQKRRPITSVVAQVLRDNNTLPTSSPAYQDKVSSSSSTASVQRTQPDDNVSREDSAPSFNNSNNHLSLSSSSSIHNLTTSSTSVQPLKRKREENSIQNSSRYPAGESRRDSNPSSNSGCIIIDVTDD
jgi:hypothetical protein